MRVDEISKSSKNDYKNDQKNFKGTNKHLNEFQGYSNVELNEIRQRKT
jgi:hypothetical protein